jgi:hypothetical protein
LTEDKKEIVEACIAMAGGVVKGLKDAQNYGHIDGNEAFDMAFEALTGRPPTEAKRPLMKMRAQVIHDLLEETDE